MFWPIPRKEWHQQWQAMTRETRIRHQQWVFSPLGFIITWRYVWRFPKIHVPQIIQVMDDHDLVLKPWPRGSPILRNPGMGHTLDTLSTPHSKPLGLQISVDQIELVDVPGSGVGSMSMGHWGSFKGTIMNNHWPAISIYFHFFDMGSMFCCVLWNIVIHDNPPLNVGIWDN